ncbi:MAG: 3-phosphoshikimate 1-carboxyvinyltransferase [Planctomycetota bacterium]
MNQANSASIQPVGSIDSSIRPPGSKSITNRALVCAALAQGKSTLTGVLASDDTRVMIEAWIQLGLELDHDLSVAEVSLKGCAGSSSVTSGDIFVGNSGTTIRFLAAALCVLQGEFRLDGVARMRERPIGDLLTALRELGAQVDSLNSEKSDCPPIHIVASGLSGGKAQVKGDISSQFLSGLMLASPMAESDVGLEIVGDLVSVPYVEMTAEVMRSFGARVDLEFPRIRIQAGSKYQAREYSIEPDASAASYFWAAAAITGGLAEVKGLSRGSLQGDVGFCDVLAQMGCEVDYGDNQITVRSNRQLRGIEVNMANISDTVQTLAAVALFAAGPTTVRGVAHNRVKETDRIGDLATELRKLGADVTEFDDGMKITPPEKVQPATLDTYDDHRMAMSLALTGLRAEGIKINDPDCTSKTYPGYWDDLATFSGSIIRR